jgi:hypothetical protein
MRTGSVAGELMIAGLEGTASQHAFGAAGGSGEGDAEDSRPLLAAAEDAQGRQALADDAGLDVAASQHAGHADAVALDASRIGRDVGAARQQFATGTEHPDAGGGVAPDTGRDRGPTASVGC